MIWGCPRQRKDGSWVPGCHPGGKGWPALRSARVKGGDGHACHKQMVAINFVSGESSTGENFTGLSAKMTWVYFCRVVGTQSPLYI